MKEKIVLDEHKIKKIKKRIKKSLEDFGLNLKQSEVAEIIAKSLGFKNDYELRKFISEVEDFNNEIKEPSLPINSISSLIENSNIQLNDKYQMLIKYEYGKKIINIAFNRRHPDIINDKKYYNELIKNLYENYLKNINGNILICGTAGSGKTLMTKKITEISKNSNNRLLSIGDLKSEHILEEELRSPEDLEILHNNRKNLIFSIHARESETFKIIERIKEIEKSCEKKVDIDRIKVIITLEWIR